MFYFVIQTLLLSLLVFIVGLFIGIFFKHLLCKQHLKIVASYAMLKKKGQSHLHRKRIKEEQSSSVHGSICNVKPSESAALAKKRTAALVAGRRRASGM